MDDRSDLELKSAVRDEELQPRKRAIAQEVLRRRYKASGGGRLWTYVWLPLIGLLATSRFVLRRRQPRE